jgi:hypothetical protein
MEEGLNEEAIAETYAHYIERSERRKARGEKPESGTIGRLFDRLRNAIAAIGRGIARGPRAAGVRGLKTAFFDAPFTDLFDKT